MNPTTKPTNPYPNIHHTHLNQNSQHHKPWERIPTIETWSIDPYANVNHIIFIYEDTIHPCPLKKSINYKSKLN
jgi:hypothetical protein